MQSSIANSVAGRGAQGDTTSASSQGQLDRIVLNYLRRKGYRMSEDALKREARLQTLNELSCELQPGTDASIADYLLYYNQTEQGDPQVYQRSFASLRRWLDTSLDMYRPELRAVLFPICAHVYLEMLSKNMAEEAIAFMNTYRDELQDEHPADTQRLCTITSKQHAQESEYARNLLSEKYNLRMSSVALRLLVSFLLDQQHMLLLRIVSQHLNIQVTSDTSAVDGEDLGIIGQTTMQIDGLNQTEVQLSRPPLDAAFREEVERALQQAEDALTEDARKRKAVDEKPGTTEPSPLTEAFRQQHANQSSASDHIPLPPHTVFDVRREVQRIKDLAKQLTLGPKALPSICCYTAHNTNDSLNCMTFSDDMRLLACGFSESYIKLWSLDEQPLSGLRNDIDTRKLQQATNLSELRESGSTNCRRLVGHSGPVYATSFSPDSRFMVSSSEDATVRLWSLDTYANVVCYRGHNYPVWDVEFGPYGVYFATASHDRTARLWSCEYPHPLRIFAGHLSDVDCVKFHPNSRYLLTGSSDQTARMWDVQHGQCVRILKDHRAPIYSLAVSSDGRMAASAGADSTIRLWDLGSGRLIKRLFGHQSCVQSLAFSAEGSLLCSGGTDNTVRVWDVARLPTEAEQQAAREALTKSIHGATKGHGRHGRGAQQKSGSSAKGVAAESGSGANSKPLQYESGDLLGTFPTKSTPIYSVQVTRRNLVVVGGAFTPQS